MKTYIVTNRAINSIEGIFLNEGNAKEYIKNKPGYNLTIMEKLVDTDIKESALAQATIPDFEEFCKNHIKDNILDYIDCNIDDLSDDITQTMNCNGTFTFSTYLAKQYIAVWDSEAGDFYEYMQDNFGEALYNPFDNPEALTVCMVIEGVRSLIVQTSVYSEHSDKELTKRFANKILKEIENLNIDWL